MHDYALRGGYPVKELPGILSVKTVMVGDDELTVVRIVGHQLALDFQRATFMATNVRTEQDIDTIVRMVGTYASPTWQKAKRQLREGQQRK